MDWKLAAEWVVVKDKMKAENSVFHLVDRWDVKTADSLVASMADNLGECWVGCLVDWMVA